MRKTVPIFFACNDKYVPYLDVAIVSLVSHASDENDYKITIMKTDISEENQAVLKKHATDNVSIDFYDVKEMIEPVKDKLPEMFYFGIAAYFRFFSFLSLIRFCDTIAFTFSMISTLYHIMIRKSSVYGKLSLW